MLPREVQTQKKVVIPFFFVDFFRQHAQMTVDRSLLEAIRTQDSAAVCSWTKDLAPEVCDAAWTCVCSTEKMDQRLVDRVASLCFTNAPASELLTRIEEAMRLRHKKALLALMRVVDSACADCTKTFRASTVLDLAVDLRLPAAQLDLLLRRRVGTDDLWLAFVQSVATDNRAHAELFIETNLKQLAADVPLKLCKAWPDVYMLLKFASADEGAEADADLCSFETFLRRQNPVCLTVSWFARFFDYWREEQERLEILRKQKAAEASWVQLLRGEDYENVRKSLPERARKTPHKLFHDLMLVAELDNPELLAIYARVDAFAVLRTYAQAIVHTACACSSERILSWFLGRQTGVLVHGWIFRRACQLGQFSRALDHLLFVLPQLLLEPKQLQQTLSHIQNARLAHDTTNAKKLCIVQSQTLRPLPSLPSDEEDEKEDATRKAKQCTTLVFFKAALRTNHQQLAESVLQGADCFRVLSTLFETAPGEMPALLEALRRKSWIELEIFIDFHFCAWQRRQSERVREFLASHPDCDFATLKQRKLLCYK